MLAELREYLLNGRYRPQPVRRVYIPQPGRPKERRPLGIPRVRDRVAQTAAKLVLEPIFEASFLPCSFGFRPKRTAVVDLKVRRKRGLRPSRITEGLFEALRHSSTFRVPLTTTRRSGSPTAAQATGAFLGCSERAGFSRLSKSRPPGISFEGIER